LEHGCAIRERPAARADAGAPIAPNRKSAIGKFPDFLIPFLARPHTIKLD